VSAAVTIVAAGGGAGFNDDSFIYKDNRCCNSDKL